MIPSTPRVVFRKSPLFEVTSQLRFPPILRIHAQSPAEFQDAIRDEYPFYALEHQVPKSQKSGSQPSQQLTINLATTPNLAHAFHSADKLSSYRLANHELAIRSLNYDRWEKFRSRILKGATALIKQYQPAFFSHVCVKYRNAILRSAVGMPDQSWSRLLNPAVLGSLGIAEFDGTVEKQESKFTLRLPGDAGRIDATIGLGTHPSIAEKAVLIETHVYSDGQTRPSDVGSKLDTLHQFAGIFFRWCLQRPLYDAFEPSGVESER
jgi:uncharacterized protein (TIGR04255 family)